MLFVGVLSSYAFCIYSTFTIFTDWWYWWDEANLQCILRIHKDWSEYAVWCRFLPCRVDYGLICCWLCPQLLLNLLLFPQPTEKRQVRYSSVQTSQTDTLVIWQTGSRTQWFCNVSWSRYIPTMVDYFLVYPFCLDEPRIFQNSDIFRELFSFICTLFPGNFGNLFVSSFGLTHWHNLHRKTTFEISFWLIVV